MLQRKKRSPVSSRRPLSLTGGRCGRLVEQEWSDLDGLASASRDGAELEFANESCNKPRGLRREESALLLFCEHVKNTGQKKVSSSALRIPIGNQWYSQ
jgi:hypothetical protein